MHDWLPFRDAFLQEMLSGEAPSQDKSCSSCQEAKTTTMYRCSDCFHSGLVCLECCLKNHIQHPFHCIQEWTGQYFAPTTLETLGFILHLGHGGSSCSDVGENNGEGMRDSITTLVVMDIGQIYTHKVSWCKCSDAPTKPIQLLQTGLYPGSVDSPRSAFTFRLMDYYHVDSTECNTTPQSFCTKLRRLTNRYHPHTVPVSVILLEYLIISDWKTGPLQRIDQSITTMGQYPGPHAVWIWT